MKKLGILTLITLLIVLLSNCKRDELDFDKLSNWTVVERELAAPLVYGNISIENLVENDEDSVIVIDGDTVKLVFTTDSVYYLTIHELVNFSDQAPYPYVLTNDQNIDLTGIPTGTRLEPEISDLINDTIFTLALTNSVRIDSVWLYQGNLEIDVTNNFTHEMILVITSSSLISPSGEFFIDSITNILPGQTTTGIFNVDDYKVSTTIDTNNNSAISLKFKPILIKGSDDIISMNDNAIVNFDMDQIEEFNAIFGFFGYQSERIDTVLEDFAPDVFEGLEGELNVTNPKIRLHYKNSIGVSADIAMILDLYHESSSLPIQIDLGTQRLGYSDDYLMPEYFGNILYDRTTVANIDEIIAVPMPETINAVADVYSNVGVDSATVYNWGLNDSELLVSVSVEVPLEFSADLTYTDTMKISDGGEDDEATYEMEYAILHYKFENYFPLGFGGDLVVYDSIADINLGTIDLNPAGGMFLEAAPVDANGNVIRSQVNEYKDEIAIDADLAEVILQDATHIIFRAQLLTTNASSVKVGVDSELNFQFGIEAKGKYYPE